MKRAKIIISLQILFITIAIIFSAGITYNNYSNACMGTMPSAPAPVVNLAIRQKGYELVASADRYDAYQGELATMHAMINAAAALIQGKVPDDAERIAIEGAEELYLVPIITDQETKETVLVAMSVRQQPAEVTELIPADDALSSELGVFIGFPPAELIVAHTVADPDTPKTSSAGMLPAHAQALGELSSGQADVSMLQSILETLESLKREYEKAAANLTGMQQQQARYNLQYASDTLALIGTTLDASRIPQVSQQFTLLLDKTSLPAGQLALAISIGEIAQIEEKLNCKIIITDPSSIPAGLTPANSIAITSSPEAFQRAGARAIEVEMSEQRYMPLTQLAVFAKAVFIAGQVDQAQIGIMRNIISNAYRLLTGTPLATTVLDGYLNDPTRFIISLVLPDISIVYEQGEIENLHRQALAALIAA
jgi:hypothetical protein